MFATFVWDPGIFAMFLPAQVRLLTEKSTLPPQSRLNAPLAPRGHCGILFSFGRLQWDEKDGKAQEQVHQLLTGQRPLMKHDPPAVNRAGDSNRHTPDRSAKESDSRAHSTHLSMKVVK